MIFLWLAYAGIFLIGCSNDSLKKAPPLSKPIIWLNNPDNIQNITFSNQVLLLEFLTNDCEGCIQLLSSLSKVKNDYGKSIDIVGIYTPNPNSPLGQLDASYYVKSIGISYPVVYDKEAKLFNAYQIIGWPTLILINKKGDIQETIYGIHSADYLSQVIQKLIKGELE